jgi:hypothetical protein
MADNDKKDDNWRRDGGSSHAGNAVTSGMWNNENKQGGGSK